MLYVLLHFVLRIIVTGFHKTWLPHTQNQMHDFTWNELLVQYLFIMHCTLPSGMASLVSTVAFFWPCNSHEWAIVWRYLVVRTLFDCFVESCAFSVSLPILISLNLMWLQWIEWLQKAQTWPPDSNHLGSPFYAPMLSPPIAPTHYPYYYHLWYYYPFEKSCPKQGLFSVSETCTPTQW